MIEKIENPKTDLYKHLKEIILGSEFPWYYHHNTVEYDGNEKYDDELHVKHPFYSHSILSRPGLNEPNPKSIFYPQVSSQYIDLSHDLFVEIARKNNIGIEVIYRINANQVYPIEGSKCCLPHVDHYFPHKNMIIYLTNPNGGYITCEGKTILPNEDDIVVLEGKHYAKTPSHGRRVALVYTYMDTELAERYKN